MFSPNGRWDPLEESHSVGSPVTWTPLYNYDAIQ